MLNESQNIEYKESWRDEYLKWICGFANAQGGKIYIGVNDKRVVIGASDAKRLMEDIPNKVRDVLGLIVDVNLLVDNNLEFIEIIVEASNIPISYKGQYHYRSGSTKQELKGVALQQFILKKMGRQWDDVFHESATVDCIDPKAVRYLIRKGINAGRITEDTYGDSDREVLENLNLVSDEGKLKYAAILLFAQKPQKFFTGVQFKIGRFGVDETDLWFQDVVEGNILQMADRVIELLRSKYLTSPIHYDGMLRMEPIEIPEVALREIIYNAIIHKHYGGAPIQLRVFGDHLELWNEGKLPEDFTIATLMTKHSSRPRNHNIADTFYKAGFIESWGRGIKKICDGFLEAGLPIPTFEEYCGGLLVTIPRNVANNKDTVLENQEEDNVSSKKQLNTKALIVLDLIKENPQITLEEIAQECGMSTRGAHYYTEILQKENYIIRDGSKKNGVWKILD